MKFAIARMRSLGRRGDRSQKALALGAKHD